MAENKTLGSPEKMATPKPSSLSDTHSRDQFIAVALKEIIKDQIAKKQWNHDQAAVLAVRYANAVMVARGDTEPLKVMVAKGTRTDTAIPPNVELPLGNPFPDGAEKSAKTISEIIGDADPVAEVK